MRHHHGNEASPAVLVHGALKSFSTQRKRLVRLQKPDLHQRDQTGLLHGRVSLTQTPAVSRHTGVHRAHRAAVPLYLIGGVRHESGVQHGFVGVGVCEVTLHLQDSVLPGHEQSDQRTFTDRTLNTAQISINMKNNRIHNSQLLKNENM